MYDSHNCKKKKKVFKSWTLDDDLMYVLTQKYLIIYKQYNVQYCMPLFSKCGFKFFMIDL